MHKDSVVDYPTGHSVDDYRYICIRKLVSFLTQFLTALVNKSNAWWQRGNGLSILTVKSAG